MADIFTEWHDLTPLGFPGWEASRAVRLACFERAGPAMVQAVRPVGCVLDLSYHGKDGAELFAKMSETIERVNHWTSPENKARLRQEHEEWQREMAASRATEVKPMDPNASRHSFSRLPTAPAPAQATSQEPQGCTE